MREITKLIISFLYLIFLLPVVCMQGSNVINTLFRLIPKVTTCADVCAELLIMPLSNPWLDSLFYGDTQESISMNYIMYEFGIQNNICPHIRGLGLAVTSVADRGWLVGVI